MGWDARPIGAVCEPTAQRDPRRDPGTEFHYVDISGVDRLHKNIAEYKTLCGADAPSRARKVVHKDDVLVATVRPNLNAVAMVPEELSGHIASTGFCVLRANRSLVEPRYLFYWTISLDFVSALTAKVRGANYPAVSDGEVKGVEIPFAPLSEQRRIVEILDQADRLRRLRAEADAKADRILPALFIKMFGDPVENARQWPTEPLRAAVETIEAGWSANGEARLREANEYGVLKVSAVTSGAFRPSEHKAVPAESTDRALVTPRRGDLLLSRANTRELVAAACIVESDEPNLFLPDKLWRVTPRSDRATGPYLNELLRVASFRDTIRARATGTSGSMLNVSQSAFLATRAPLPPTTLQHKFSDHFWQVIQSRRSGRNARCCLGQLWSNLLAQGFSGSLTATWREAHMKELLQEMEQQAKALAEATP